ncbi:hypothetical protein VPH35_140660 [Triticum aestivum]
MAMRGGHCHKEFHVRVFDKVRHRRQHGGESPASCVTGDEHGGKSPASCVTGGEHGGESPASCGTGGKHAAASMPRRCARGEGAGGMALAAVCVMRRRRQQPLASREK